MFSLERMTRSREKPVEGKPAIPENIQHTITTATAPFLTSEGKIKPGNEDAFVAAIRAAIPEDQYHLVSEAVMQIHRNIKNTGIIQVITDRIQGQKHDVPLTRAAGTIADPWIGAIRQLEEEHGIAIFGNRLH